MARIETRKESTKEIGTQRLLRTLVAVSGLGVGAAAVDAQVFSSTPGTGAFDLATQLAPITVSGGPSSINRLSVIVNISTTWCSDVDAAIIRRDPINGDTYLHLFSDVGGSADNFTVTRMIDGAPTIVNGVAPFNGNYSAEGGALVARAAAAPLPPTALANFAGFNGRNSNVTWELWVDDDLGGFPFTLNYWSLEFNGASDPNGPSSPASGAGAVTPSTGFAGVTTARFTVIASPGFNPPSAATGVTLDLSQLGGPAAQTLFDNGTNGDQVASDGVFSIAYPIAVAVGSGNYTLPWTLTSNIGGTANGTIAIAIDAPPSANQYVELFPPNVEAGDLLTTAAIVQGSGGALNSIRGRLGPDDVDMYAINICSPTTFSVTSFPTPTGGITDTQLFLFNANGVGIVYNDDIPDGQPGDTTLLSRISSTFVAALPAGTYYLAVSQYDRDPVSSGAALLWANTPFNTERAPDGPGASNSLFAWTGTTAGNVPYALAFTGTCFVEANSCPACPADFDQDGGVTGGDIAAFFADFQTGAACADTDLDGGITGGDIAAFFQAFQAGGC